MIRLPRPEPTNQKTMQRVAWRLRRVCFLLLRFASLRRVLKPLSMQADRSTAHLYTDEPPLLRPVHMCQDCRRYVNCNRELSPICMECGFRRLNHQSKRVSSTS